MFPTADVIATAIYAAARAMVPSTKLNAVALSIAHGAKDSGVHMGNGGDFPLARSRCYAAVALWDAYPEASRAKIGRALGQPNPEVWAPKLDKDLAGGRVKWWSDDAECAVRNAVAWAIERSAPVDLPEFVGGTFDVARD